MSEKSKVKRCLRFTQYELPSDDTFVKTEKYCCQKRPRLLVNDQPLNMTINKSIIDIAGQPTFDLGSSVSKSLSTKTTSDESEYSAYFSGSDIHSIENSDIGHQSSGYLSNASASYHDIHENNATHRRNVPCTIVSNHVKQFELHDDIPQFPLAASSPIKPVNQEEFKTRKDFNDSLEWVDYQLEMAMKQGARQMSEQTMTKRRKIMREIADDIIARGPKPKSVKPKTEQFHSMRFDVKPITNVKEKFKRTISVDKFATIRCVTQPTPTFLRAKAGTSSFGNAVIDAQSKSPTTEQFYSMQNIPVEVDPEILVEVEKQLAAMGCIEETPYVISKRKQLINQMIAAKSNKKKKFKRTISVDQFFKR